MICQNFSNFFCQAIHNYSSFNCFLITFILSLTLQQCQIVYQWISRCNLISQLGSADSQTYTMLCCMQYLYRIFTFKPWNFAIIDRIHQLQSSLREIPIASPSKNSKLRENIFSFQVHSCKVTLECNIPRKHLYACAHSLESASAAVQFKRVVPEDLHMCSVTATGFVCFHWV